MTDYHRENNKRFWNKILKAPRILSNEEADAMLETVKNLRKEYGFRR